MSKQTTKTSPKPPADPVESAQAMLDRVGNVRGSPIREETIAMLQTVLVVRAIDRLTAAVKDNTKAVRQG